MARVDDIHRRNRVSAARRIIYEKKFQVNSTAVEALLREKSFVPNVVCQAKYHSYEGELISMMA